MPWKTLKSKAILKNSFFEITDNLCEKENGELVNNYYIVKRPEIVIVAAFTPDMKLILIDQYRYPVNSIDTELPAGYVEAHEKDLKEAAHRELLEETGYQCKSYIQLNSKFASAGFLNNQIHFFIGFDAEKTQEQQLDQHEEITVKPTSWTEALKLLEENKIKDLGSATGVLLAQQYFNQHPKT